MRMAEQSLRIDIEPSYGTWANKTSMIQKPESNGCCSKLFACCCTSIIYTIIILLVLAFIFGISALCIGIGVNHQNTTCDDNYHIYRLSTWLITVGAVNFVTIIIIGLALFMKYECIIIIVYLSHGVFSLTMTIMGIIELAHVFPKCEIEAFPLTTMVIFMVVMQLLALVGTCSVAKKEK